VRTPIVAVTLLRFVRFDTRTIFSVRVLERRPWLTSRSWVPALRAWLPRQDCKRPAFRPSSSSRTASPADVLDIFAAKVLRSMWGRRHLLIVAPGGVGGDFLKAIGLEDLEVEELPGYVAWLPNRRVTLARDPGHWLRERLSMLGDSPAHQRFWKILDHLAAVFWTTTRRGVKLPVRSFGDVCRIAAAVAPADWPLARYLRWTVGDLFRSLGLRTDSSFRITTRRWETATPCSSPYRLPAIHSAALTVAGP